MPACLLPVMRHACWLFFALLAASTASAADLAKTLHVEFRMAETSFDPVSGSDAASLAVIEHIMDAMLEYEYLARPVRLKPATLERLPEVADNGATFICRLRKGLFFSPDAAFGGKPRELVAADYAYSLKRFLDPALRSPWSWLVEGKLLGSDEARRVAIASGRFDYDAALPGLEVVDRYTLKIRLVAPDHNFLYTLAMPATAVVAREVVEAYGNDIGAHPVGTGPYLLKSYRRSNRIGLEANPGFRREVFDEKAQAGADRELAKSLSGKTLPRIGRIDIAVIEEAQSRWLAFLDSQLDYLQQLPADFVDVALDHGTLRPELAARGLRQEVLVRPNTWWAYFDMEDPLVGGYTQDKIALRRAIGMAFDGAEYIRVLLKGRAIPARGIVPPDIAGFDPAFHSDALRYDPAAARALLDRFGYRDRDGDGYRERPDGKPLTIERWSVPTLIERQGDELWKKNMDAIGIRLSFRKDKLPELRKMARAGKIQMRSDGWNADYPDAENYMQLLYGPNRGQTNDSRFRLAEFDRLYEEARRLPDSPERTRIYDRMTALILVYAPMRLSHHLLEDHILHDWVLGYKPHPLRVEIWKYLDIDVEKRGR